MTNPIAGSHRTLVVHGGRVVAAALVGDLSRVGLITQLYDRGTVLGPDEPGQLLLGEPASARVRLADDASMPLALQDRLIREGDRLTPDSPYDVRTLEGSHLKWLVDPAPAARVLGELAVPLESTPS